MQIFQLLGPLSEVYLWDFVKQEYQKKYKESLPEDWPQQIISKAARGIVLEKLFDGRYTIKIQPYIQVSYLLFN